MGIWVGVVLLQLKIDFIFKVKKKNKKETEIRRYGWHNTSLWVAIHYVTLLNQSFLLFI